VCICVRKQCVVQELEQGPCNEERPGMAVESPERDRERRRRDDRDEQRDSGERL